MEGQVTSKKHSYRRLLIYAVSFGAWVTFGIGYAQEKSAAPERVGQAEMSLRKSVNTREFQGQQVEGEERQIGHGDKDVIDPEPTRHELALRAGQPPFLQGR